MNQSSTTMNVPTPKTPTKYNITTDRDTRIKVQTLYFDANWTEDDIALQLNLTRNQVAYAIDHRFTPQKHSTGVKPLLNTPQRKQLIEWVTASKENRAVPWPNIPFILGWECGYQAIRTAFKREGYCRAVARRKPALSKQNAIDRLAWAWEHFWWTDDDWDNVLWSDETWVMPGTHKRTHVTRKIGLSEVYHPDCVAPRYQRKIGWMFWGSISGKYGRHESLFWEKEWKSINRLYVIYYITKLS
jgi:hypothetical protein